MAQQILTAIFDQRAHATDATAKLLDAGIPRSAIRLFPENDSDVTTSTSTYDYRKDEKGFWASLGDLFMPDEDRAAYAEGMNRGGSTVSVTVDDTQSDEVADILDEHGSIDLDERETTWRSEGWNGYTQAASPAMGTRDSTAAMGARDATAPMGVRDATASGGDSQAIPIVEEQLRVGKREVAGGRVKIRSYTVETPVEEQVTLRSKSVHVERRPVDRAATAADANLFQDHTIELEETREEAVVSKEARVTGEVHVRKDVDDHVETVTDSVRRTEVDVQDERADTSRTDTSRAGSTRTDISRNPVNIDTKRGF